MYMYSYMPFSKHLLAVTDHWARRNSHIRTAARGSGQERQNRTAVEQLRICFLGRPEDPRSWELVLICWVAVKGDFSISTTKSIKGYDLDGGPYDEYSCGCDLDGIPEQQPSLPAYGRFVLGKFVRGSTKLPRLPRTKSTVQREARALSG